MNPAEAETGDHAKCEKMLDQALTSNKYIQHLLTTISQMGCEIPRSAISCRPCDLQARGMFRSLPAGNNISSSVSAGAAGTVGDVVMCENHLSFQDDFENTIVHELIHAYDNCKHKGTNAQASCDYHACTEIRAANLSGDCGFAMEVLRGNLNLFGNKDCVTRRTALALSNTPECIRSDLNCRDTIEKSMEKCYADLSPFSKEFRPPL